MHSLSLTLVAFGCIAGACSAFVIKQPVRPVVFYHGMGDSAHSNGMLQLFESIKDIAPDIFIHSVYLAESESDDQRAGFFGNVNKQIETVCQQLRGVKELKGGFNAVGFSQGGQFLRAYIQRCNDPPVHNLVTLGSQHGGVSDIPGCLQDDPSCRLMRTIARSGVYSGYVRDHIIQAQYYKDPLKLATYLERNIFLPDINNERTSKNATYVKHLTSINKLVMFMFMNDITVKPKETAWFGFQVENGDVIDLEDQDQYKEDWLGLRTMDKAGKLVFEILESEHMQFSLEEFTEKITLPYLLEIDDSATRRHGGRKSKGHGKPKGMVDQTEDRINDFEIKDQLQMIL